MIRDFHRGVMHRRREAGKSHGRQLLAGLRAISQYGTHAIERLDNLPDYEQPVPPPKNSPNWTWVVLLVVCVSVGLALRFSLHQSKPPAASHRPSADLPSAAVATPGAPPALPAPISEPKSAPDRLQQVSDSLRAAPDPETARRLLAELRGALAGMPRHESLATIRRFLDAKTDAPTHLGFKLAANGLLDDAPTLRTFLLDELARLDPAASADYSRVVLASMDSPDEWAIALRNLAGGDPTEDGRSLLRQKTAEMLRYAPWQQNPSVGYLQSFDVAVYLGGTDLLPTLSDLVRPQDNPALAHASYLALDRLVINQPAAVLAALETAPDLMQGREATRANFFARADVRDPQQRQVLETYLLNPSLGAAELNAFAGVYPNMNFMLSANLLTQNATPNHEALISLDAQALVVAQEWLADPRFAPLAPALNRITQRLAGLVAQTRPGR